MKIAKVAGGYEPSLVLATAHMVGKIQPSLRECRREMESLIAVATGHRLTGLMRRASTARHVEVVQASI